VCVCVGGGRDKHRPGCCMDSAFNLVSGEGGGELGGGGGQVHTHSHHRHRAVLSALLAPSRSFRPGCDMNSAFNLQLQEG
jgi:hypothetical protein